MVPDVNCRTDHGDIDKGKRRGTELQQNKIGNADNHPQKRYRNIVCIPVCEKERRGKRDGNNQYIIEKNQRMGKHGTEGWKQGLSGKAVNQKLQDDG